MKHVVPPVGILGSCPSHPPAIAAPDYYSPLVIDLNNLSRQVIDVDILSGLLIDRYNLSTLVQTTYRLRSISCPNKLSRSTNKCEYSAGGSRIAYDNAAGRSV